VVGAIVGCTGGPPPALEEPPPPPPQAASATKHANDNILWFDIARFTAVLPRLSFLLAIEKGPFDHA
jgi:hypothetical protein